MLLPDDWQVKPESEWRLRGIQVKALTALRDHKRGFFGIGVGGGKTLLTMLANRALGIEPSEVIALTTASLRDEADLEFEKYRRELDVDYIPMVSYSELSRNKKLLWEREPKCIICDEVHKLKNQNTVRTRSFVRYMKDFPDTSFIPMTGTLTTTSIRDYIHLFALAVGRDRNPLPDPWDRWPQVETLSRVIDPSPEIPPDGHDYRQAAWLLNKKDDESFREAFHRVLTSVPFVILSEESEFDGPLEMKEWEPEVPITLRNTVKDIKEGMLPSGEFIANQTSLWQKKHQAATGFYYRFLWTDEHSPEYHRATRGLHDYIQDTIKKEKRKKFGLTTDAQVLNALRSGELTSQAYEDWLPFSEIPDPEREPVILTEKILRESILFCRSLLTEGVGILLWYEYEAQRDLFRGFAEEFEDVVVVEPNEAPPRNLDKPLVAVVSKYSHSTGINLQDDYSVNVDICPNSNIGQYEQYLGRTHRPGQKQGVVCYTNQSFPFFKDALYKAKRKAQYVEETTKQKTKLLLAKG